MNKFFAKIQKRRLWKEVDSVFDDYAESIQSLWKELEAKNRSEYDKILNTITFSILNAQDIRLLANIYSDEKRKVPKNLHARHLCTSIIEYLNDINGLLGKELREDLENKNLTEFLDEIKSVNKAYSKLRHENSKILGSIRNNSSAHKNKDAKVLLNHYVELPIDEVSLLRLVVDISEINNRLIVHGTPILKEIIRQEQKT